MTASEPTEPSGPTGPTGPPGPPARRCLVVANRTLGGEELLDALRERLDRGPHVFHVLVPATPLTEQDTAGTPTGGGPSAEERAYALARQRLDVALRQLVDLGAQADGEVGDPDALTAVRLALARFPAEEIVVSTLPLGMSRWLRGDLPSRLGRTTGLPVTHVVDGARAPR